MHYFKSWLEYCKLVIMSNRENSNENQQRGFFAIGSEGLSKAYNAGAIYRTAHAFDASFIFTVGSNIAHGVKSGKQNVGNSGLSNSFKSVDTSSSDRHVPYFEFPDWNSFARPAKTALVGVELVDSSINLPNFYHPKRAVYVLGPEDGSLAPETISACDYIIKIPTKFCINVGLAAAIVMYDRQLQLGQYQPRNKMNKGLFMNFNDIWVPDDIVNIKQHEQTPFEYIADPRKHRTN